MVNLPIALVLLAAATWAPSASAEQERDLMLEALLEPARTYVQAQAIYRLRFYQAVDVRELKISAPSPRLADVEPIGDVRIYETLRGGRRYRVHERSYAVFPFTSGPLELGGAYASARVAHAGGAGDGRQMVRIDAAARTLVVLPVADATGTWIPARSVSMSESWAHAPEQMRAGHPQQRTIRIEAVGVRAEQIPELHMAADGMTVHAGPARLENRLDGELHVGVREQTFSMVPLRGGAIVIPALQLRWWNVESGDAASAELAARTLYVNGDAAVPVPPPQQRSLPVPRQLIAMLAATMAALFVIYLYRQRLASAWRLRRLVRTGDMRALRDELLMQASAVWPHEPRTLPELAARLDDPAAQCDLFNMDRALYGGRECRDMRSQTDAARRVLRAIRRGRRIARRP